MKMPLSYKIVVDSTADFTPEMKRKWKQHLMILPLHFTPKKYDKMGVEKFYQYQRRQIEVIRTSSTALAEAKASLGVVLSQGQDVIYLTMASALSEGSYAVAKQASAEMLRRYPKRRITVIDSECVTLGLGLLVEQVLELELSYDDAVRFLEEQKSHMIHLFTIEEYSQVVASGRFDKNRNKWWGKLLFSSFGQKLLRVMDHEHFLGQRVKVLLGFYGEGKNKALLPLRFLLSGRKGLARAFTKEVAKYKPQGNIMIAWGVNRPLANLIYEELRKRYSQEQLKMDSCRIGPVVGAHTGGTVVGVFFWGEEGPLRKK